MVSSDWGDFKCVSGAPSNNDTLGFPRRPDFWLNILQWSTKVKLKYLDAFKIHVRFGQNAARPKDQIFVWATTRSSSPFSTSVHSSASSAPGQAWSFRSDAPLQMKPFKGNQRHISPGLTCHFRPIAMSCGRFYQARDPSLSWVWGALCKVKCR